MKDRKFKVFMIILGLTQYYFVFGKLDQNIWFTATVWILGSYFVANVAEGSVGKEKKVEGKI